MKQYGSSKPTLGSLLPENKKDRIKLISAVSVTAICLLWLSYFIISHMSWQGPAKPLTTPAWNAANEWNAKLLERTEFHDVGVSVVTEKPVRYKVSGMVRSAKDMESLKAFLTEIGEYDMDVSILGQPSGG